MGAENPTDAELITKLEERVTQLTSEVEGQATKIEDLETSNKSLSDKVAVLESEESGEITPPPVEESAELKQFKQELSDEQVKLSNDRQAVTDDEAVIAQLEAKIKAITG